MGEVLSRTATFAIVAALAACAGSVQEPPKQVQSKSELVSEQIAAEATAVDDRIEVRLYVERSCDAAPASDPCGRRPVGAGVPVRVVFFDASEQRATSDARGIDSIRLDAPITSASLQAGKADVLVRDARAGQVDLTNLAQWTSWHASIETERAAKGRQAAADTEEREFQAAAQACQAATTLQDCVPLTKLAGRYGNAPERMRGLVAALREGLPRGLDDAQNKFQVGCSLSPLWCVMSAGSFIELLQQPAVRVCVGDVDQRIALVRRVAIAAKNAAASAPAASAEQPAPLFSYAAAQASAAANSGEERHQQEMREMQSRHDEETRQRDRDDHDAQSRRDEEKRHAEEDRQRHESEEQGRRSQASFQCYTACERAHVSCRIGNGPDYNETCLAQLEASHNACCTGAGMRSAWPTCACSER